MENYYFWKDCGSLLYQIEEKNYLYLNIIKPIYFQQLIEINSYDIYKKILIYNFKSLAEELKIR